ncbi:MAG: BrnA antitoxin family protein [Bosea sp. (in: a-proteobacteria)]
MRATPEAEIEAIAVTDSDNPASPNEEWTRMSVVLPPRKTPVNAMFDADVVAWFKAGGRGYQTRMNAVLRRFMEAQRKAG